MSANHSRDLSLSTIENAEYSSIATSQGSSNELSSVENLSDDEEEPTSTRDNASVPSSTYDEELDDPLGVKKLALSFDYLIYRIGEKLNTVAEQTEDCVSLRKQYADQEIASADESINNLKGLLKQCEDLDNELLKVEQFGYIISEFKERIRSLDEFYAAKQHHK